MIKNLNEKLETMHKTTKHKAYAVQWYVKLWSNAYGGITRHYATIEPLHGNGQEKGLPFKKEYGAILKALRLNIVTNIAEQTGLKLVIGWNETENGFHYRQTAFEITTSNRDALVGFLNSRVDELNNNELTATITQAHIDLYKHLKKLFNEWQATVSDDYKQRFSIDIDLEEYTQTSKFYKENTLAYSRTKLDEQPQEPTFDIKALENFKLF